MSFKSALFLAIFAYGTSGLFGQGNNVELLSQLDQHFFYNDIWGYHAPDGTELVLMGTDTGTAFIDATDPRNPQQIAFISGPNSTWRDIKTYLNYAYIVTEGGGGMQIVNLADPQNPVLVRTWNGFGSAHNIVIDEGAAIGYAVGTSSGNNVFSLANPGFPAAITTYGTYMHDAFARDGMLHGALIYAGTYRIIDVTNLPSMPTIDDIGTPGDFTHNVWVSEDNTIAATTDENSTGHLSLYDISNPSNIMPLAEFTTGTGSIVHNAFIKDSVVYCSWYLDGFVAVDIEDPANPALLGSYDTHPSVGSSYNGCWGCYPFQPSGAIYLSDMQSGLYIVRLNVLNIAHTPLTDTQDEVGPYRVVATIGENGGVSATLHYSDDEGSSYTPVAMTPTGNPNEYAADIPGHVSPDTIHYYLEAIDGSASARLPAEDGEAFLFNVGQVMAITFDDFESGSTWNHGGTGDDWQFGAPQGKSGDPDAAASGQFAWATDLGAPGWNGSYANNVSSWLESPSIALSGQSHVRLRYQRSLTVEDGFYDQARILVNGNEVWANEATPGGGSAHLIDEGWKSHDIDISGPSAGQSNIAIRYTLDTDGAVIYGGWNIDDFEVYAVLPSDCQPPIHYGQGLAGSGGFTPSLSTSGGFPSVGNSAFTVSGSDIMGGATTAIFVGFQRASLPFAGGEILVDLGQPYFVVTLDAQGSGPGAGSFQLPFPIPDNPSLDDLTIDLQALALDPGAPRGVSMSDGLEFVICTDG